MIMASDDETRDRSASPAREAKPKKAKTSGFKWKDSSKKPSRGEDEGSGGRLERGYRDREPRRERDSYRGRDEGRDEDRSRRYDDRRRDEGRGGDSYRPDRNEGENSYRPDKKNGGDSYRPGDCDTSERERKDEIPTAPKPKKEKKPVTSSEPMIIVNVNDRLGTKAAIPCLASDSVKAFKAMVAAQIGRQPHEIMIKRQGERPFKDVLTLEDYGVSNGVQLDLELDTGD